MRSTGTTTRTYDAFNRCTSKTVPGFGTSTFDYDITEGLEAGYSAELTIDSAGNQTLRMYDRMGRLVQFMTAGQTFRYFYNANGSLQCLAYPDGSREDYTYNVCGQVETLTNRKADNTVIDAYTYVYDAAHNLTQKTDSKGITDYTYDASNRLLTVTEPSGKVTAYTFDGAGNRATQTVTIGTDFTVTTYTYDTLNRLTLLEKTLNAALFERQQFAYDDNGNQLQTTRTTFTGGIPGAQVVTQQNTYDLRNQLVRTVTENGTIVENVYNGDGLRVEKIVNGTATFYLYEYQRVVLEQNSLGDVTGRNIYGTNLLMRTVGVDAFFYMYNAHADVTALLSTSGTIIGTYYYDAFGNILEQTGSAGNSILFAGYQYDAETGMYYLNARMYDPVTARFMQEDTYTGQYMDPLSLNLYTYCHNEPLMYSDPTGHAKRKVQQTQTSYNYHGQTLSGNSTSDNMAQRAQRQAMEREYSGNPVSNAADAARISAGFGTAADKAPTMTHSLTTITEEYRTAQDVAYDLYIEMYLGTSGSGSLEGSEVLLNALVSSTLDNATNREIRNDTIANMIAMDKNSLTPDNIEQAVLKNKVIAGIIAQEQDITDADPTFWGGVQYLGDLGAQGMYSLGESTVNLLQDAGEGLYESSANLGELTYATQAYFNGTGSLEDLSRELNQQGSYCMGFGIGVFEAVTLKPLYEAAGSVETALNGTSYISNSTNQVYSGIDNTLNYAFDMDMEAYNSTKSVGTVAVMVAGLGDVGINSARKAQVDKFIKQNVDPNFQASVKNAFTKDVKVTTNWFRDRIAYRYHGGTSTQNSYWVTPKQTLNPAADLALPPGNAYQFVDKFIIPRGTSFLEGGVAQNFGQPGGAIQYFIPDPTVLTNIT